MGLDRATRGLVGPRIRTSPWPDADPTVQVTALDLPAVRFHAGDVFTAELPDTGMT